MAVLIVSPDDILLWNDQTTDGLPEERTPPTDTSFVGVDPGTGPELEDDDLMEHPSFARTDDSDTKLEENVRQPDFVVLAKATDTPLRCHSVWEVKTLYSYGVGTTVKGAFHASVGWGASAPLTRFELRSKSQRPGGRCDGYDSPTATGFGPGSACIPRVSHAR